jgi:hypothetical protein
MYNYSNYASKYCYRYCYKYRRYIRVVLIPDVYTLGIPRVYVRYTSGIALVSLTLTKAIETVDTLDA